MNQRFDAMDQRLDVVLAISQNNWILSRNLQSPTLQRVSPLQKTVSLQKLTILSSNGISTILGAWQWYRTCSCHLREYSKSAASSCPPCRGTQHRVNTPNFIDNAAAYQRSDIISLIVFYNEDFGIVAGDTVSQCVEKLHQILTTYQWVKSLTHVYQVFFLFLHNSFRSLLDSISKSFKCHQPRSYQPRSYRWTIITFASAFENK